MEQPISPHPNPILTGENDYVDFLFRSLDIKMHFPGKGNKQEVGKS